MKCPKCNCEFSETPAISRETGEAICSKCATKEAINIAFNNGAISSTQADEIQKKIVNLDKS